MATYADRNVVQTEEGKKLKYRSLCTDIQRTWNIKCMIIMVITGVTGVVTNGLRKNLEPIPGKHSILSLKKTAILETSYIIRKVLQCETGNLSGGDRCWFKSRSERGKRHVTTTTTTTTTTT